MTNTNRRPRKPLRCIDCNRVITAENTSSALGTIDICDDCFDIAGLENEHQDGVHEDTEDGPNARCPMCTGIEIADRSKPSHAGSTIPRQMQSHAACYAAGTHAKSRAGREACRKGRNA